GRAGVGRGASVDRGVDHDERRLGLDVRAVASFEGQEEEGREQHPSAHHALLAHFGFLANRETNASFLSTSMMRSSSPTNFSFFRPSSEVLIVSSPPSSVSTDHVLFLSGTPGKRETMCVGVNSMDAFGASTRISFCVSGGMAFHFAAVSASARSNLL